MPRNITHLNALHAAETAARLGSFTRAARELGVTPAAVGQQVRILEDYLGFKLFLRTPNGLQPAPDASSALEDLHAGFDRLASGLQRLRRSGAGATLAVSVAPALAGRWLAPRLRNFYERCPHIDLRMDTSLSLVDLSGGEFNLAVRYGPEDASFATSLLFDEYMVPVCLPRLCQGSPEKSEWNEILRVPFLHIEGETSDTRALGWAAWGAYHGIYADELDRGPRYPHSMMALQAAFDGQGAVLCGITLVLDDLLSGRLAAPLGPKSAVKTHYSYRVVQSAVTATAVTQHQFVDWINEEADVTRGMVSGFLAGGRTTSG